MNITEHFPRTALARQTKRVMQSVLRGNTVIVESHGEPEAAIIDITDYYLLQGAIRFYARQPTINIDEGLTDAAVEDVQTDQERVALVIGHYMAQAISLGRAAELLDVPWLELRSRFQRLNIPMHVAPIDDEEIVSDVAAAFSYSEA